MQATQHNVNKSLNRFETARTFWRTPSFTVARLTLESYFRSGWMWTEFVLVLVFFAALFFPFQEDVPSFFGTSNWDLSAIALLGAAIMVRQATSARTYIPLARLSSRASYSRGLMLATAVLRIPIFSFMLLLVFCLLRYLFLYLPSHFLHQSQPGSSVFFFWHGLPLFSTQSVQSLDYPSLF